MNDPDVLRGAITSAAILLFVGLGFFAASRARRRSHSRLRSVVASAVARELAIPLVSNADLTEADLPARMDGWYPFALSFNGYQHWGSFEKCFEVGDRAKRAANRDALTMTELRTELFCFARAVQHTGEDPSPTELASVRAIVDAIRDRIRRGEIS